MMGGIGIPCPASYQDQTVVNDDNVRLESIGCGQLMVHEADVLPSISRHQTVMKMYSR